MNEITADKEIKSTGNSLIVYVTKELKMLDLNEGDTVRVVLQKV